LSLLLISVVVVCVSFVFLFQLAHKRPVPLTGGPSGPGGPGLPLLPEEPSPPGGPSDPAAPSLPWGNGWRKEQTKMLMI